MAHRRNQKSKMLRDFNKLDDKYIKKNMLANLRIVFKDMKENHGVERAHMELLLWAYDYEFFSVDHFAEHWGMSRGGAYHNYVYPMAKLGYFQKVYSRGDLPKRMNKEAKIFVEKYGYAHRWGLSQRSRLLVQRLYRKMMGEDPIKVDSGTKPNKKAQEEFKDQGYF